MKLENFHLTHSALFFIKLMLLSVLVADFVREIRRSRTIEDLKVRHIIINSILRFQKRARTRIRLEMCKIQKNKKEFEFLTLYWVYFRFVICLSILNSEI